MNAAACLPPLPGALTKRRKEQVAPQYPIPPSIPCTTRPPHSAVVAASLSKCPTPPCKGKAASRPSPRGLDTLNAAHSPLAAEGSAANLPPRRPSQTTPGKELFKLQSRLRLEEKQHERAELEKFSCFYREEYGHRQSIKDDEQWARDRIYRATKFGQLEVWADQRLRLEQTETAARSQILNDLISSLHTLKTHQATRDVLVEEEFTQRCKLISEAEVAVVRVRKQGEASKLLTATLSLQRIGRACLGRVTAYKAKNTYNSSVQHTVHQHEARLLLQGAESVLRSEVEQTEEDYRWYLYHCLKTEQQEQRFTVTKDADFTHLLLHATENQERASVLQLQESDQRQLLEKSFLNFTGPRWKAFHKELTLRKLQYDVDILPPTRLIQQFYINVKCGKLGRTATNNYIHQTVKNHRLHKHVLLKREAEKREFEQLRVQLEAEEQGLVQHRINEYNKVFIDFYDVEKYARLEIIDDWDWIADRYYRTFLYEWQSVFLLVEAKFCHEEDVGRGVIEEEESEVDIWGCGIHERQTIAACCIQRVFRTHKAQEQREYLTEFKPDHDNFFALQRRTRNGILWDECIQFVQMAELEDRTYDTCVESLQHRLLWKKFQQNHYKARIAEEKTLQVEECRQLRELHEDQQIDLQLAEESDRFDIKDNEDSTWQTITRQFAHELLVPAVCVMQRAVRCYHSRTDFNTRKLHHAINRILNDEKKGRHEWLFATQQHLEYIQEMFDRQTIQMQECDIRSTLRTEKAIHYYKWKTKLEQVVALEELQMRRELETARQSVVNEECAQRKDLQEIDSELRDQMKDDSLTWLVWRRKLEADVLQYINELKANEQLQRKMIVTEEYIHRDLELDSLDIQELLRQEWVKFNVKRNDKIEPKIRHVIRDEESKQRELLIGAYWGGRRRLAAASIQRVARVSIAKKATALRANAMEKRYHERMEGEFRRSKADEIGEHMLQLEKDETEERLAIIEVSAAGYELLQTKAQHAKFIYMQNLNAVLLLTPYTAHMFQQEAYYRTQMVALQTNWRNILNLVGLQDVKYIQLKTEEADALCDMCPQLESLSRSMLQEEEIFYRTQLLRWLSELQRDVGMDEFIIVEEHCRLGVYEDQIAEWVGILRVEAQRAAPLLVNQVKRLRERQDKSEDEMEDTAISLVIPPFPVLDA